jgi:hypothetical protein
MAALPVETVAALISDQYVSEGGASYLLHIDEGIGGSVPIQSRTACEVDRDRSGSVEIVGSVALDPDPAVQSIVAGPAAEPVVPGTPEEGIGVGASFDGANVGERIRSAEAVGNGAAVRESVEC